MTYYFRTKNGDSRMRVKSNQSDPLDLLEFICDDLKWVRCSFWQYYLPQWFPLIQEQKEVKYASSSDQADADHQTYDPDLAVG